MTNHQLRGHIGGNMDGIKMYDVCIVFSVYATDDDEARSIVTETLPRNREDMAWSWIYTTQTNKGETNE